MLLQFKVKNFMSFADEAVLDMAATSIKEHSDSLLEVNGNKILPIAAIFGANASGKSNFINAFNAMAYDVNETVEKGKKHDWIKPYIFDNSLNQKPSEFQIRINIKDIELRYGFSRTQDKVFEEWLFERKFAKNSKAQEKCVFFRLGNKLKMITSSVEKKEIEFVNSMLIDSDLLISGIGKRKKIKYSVIYDWFKNIPLKTDNSSDVEEFYLKNIIAGFLYDNDQMKIKVESFLQEFDNSIKGFKITKEKDKNLNDIYKIETCHFCDNGDEKFIPFESESSGTQKLFNLGFIISNTLTNGKVIWVDEFDTKLHPLVLRYIIKQFRDKNTNTGKGQIIFTSHNIVVLDSSDLRRDEIWFVEKNNQKSSLYSLYDFKEDETTIRSDLDFGKHYLSGRFGAIPFQESED